MARSRVVKPEFFDDEKLARISRDARLFFIGTWKCSDDYGVVKGNPGWLKGNIFPYDDDVQKKQVEKWLSELVEIGALFPFNHHDEKYFFITNFLKHQKVDHPSKVRNPEPPTNILLSLETLASRSRGNLDETETETETATNSPEPQSGPAPVLFFPLVNKTPSGEPEQFTIYQEDIDLWQDTYSGIDVLQIIKECRQWNIDNPTRRKTVAGIKKHINTWLGKAQNTNRNNGFSSSQHKDSSSDIPKILTTEQIARIVG